MKCVCVCVCLLGEKLSGIHGEQMVWEQLIWMNVFFIYLYIN